MKILVECRRSAWVRDAVRVAAYRVFNEEFSQLLDICVGGRRGFSDPSGPNHLRSGYCQIFLPWKTDCLPLAVLFIRFPWVNNLEIYIFNFKF